VIFTLSYKCLQVKTKQLAVNQCNLAITISTYFWVQEYISALWWSLQICKFLDMLWCAAH